MDHIISRRTEDGCSYPILMNFVSSSVLSRATLRRSAFALRAPPRAPRYQPLRPKPISPILVRGAASSVSGRPGSQTVAHAATNVKEELGNSASDVARTIAGAANMTSDAVAPTQQTFVGTMIQELGKWLKTVLPSWE